MWKVLTELKEELESALDALATSSVLSQPDWKEMNLLTAFLSSNLPHHAQLPRDIHSTDAQSYTVT